MFIYNEKERTVTVKWTNTHNLPDRVLSVIKGKYKKDKRPQYNRLSVTDLIDDSLPRILYTYHYDDIVRDYSDLLTMTQGNALHERYEMYPVDDDDEVEQKIEEVIDSMIVVGKADNKRDDTIIDVKQTGVYGPKYRIPKWTKQLNCYAWMWRKRGEDINQLLIDVWYRDWKQSNIYWRDYPVIPFEVIQLDLWDFETQDKYIRKQVQKHISHPVLDKPELYTKPCSDSTRGIRWEAYKNKNKTPTKVGDIFDEVNLWVTQQKDGNKFEIRQSEPVFCQRYCRSRSVCPFMKGK